MLCGRPYCSITLICVTQMHWECHVTPDHFDTFESMMGGTLPKGPKWHLLSLRTMQGVLELLHCRAFSSCYTAGCTRVSTLQGVLELLHCRAYSSCYTAGCTRVATLQGVLKLLHCRVFSSCYAA